MHEAMKRRGRREEEGLGLILNFDEIFGENLRQTREEHAQLSQAIFDDERLSKQWGFQGEGRPSYRVSGKESESSPAFDLHRETT